MSNRNGVGKGAVEVSRTESTERSYGRRGRLVGRVETVTVTTVEKHALLMRNYGVRGGHPARQGQIGDPGPPALVDVALRHRLRGVGGRGERTRCGNLREVLAEVSFAREGLFAVIDQIDDRLVDVSAENGGTRAGELDSEREADLSKTDDGDVWWEGIDGEVPAHLIDWHGNDWTPASDVTAAHPNSRYTVPITQCPVTAAEFNDPKGVPVSAMLFGGRRPDTVPLVSEAYSWNHGVYIGATLSSGQTAAAEGKVGSIRRDPMAMIPFIGYNVGDYLQHWIDMGEKSGDKMPKIFLVNWFRKSADGRFLWPGFGENSRVLKWIIDRIEGNVEAEETVVGHTARAEDIDLEGIDFDIEDVRAALAVNPEDWEGDMQDNASYLNFLGSRVPSEVWDQFHALKERVENAS